MGDLLPAPLSTMRLCLLEWELSRILATHLFDKMRNSDFQPWRDLYRKDRLCGPRLQVPLHGIIIIDVQGCTCVCGGYPYGAVYNNIPESEIGIDV